jgi:hypothetical protein
LIEFLTEVFKLLLAAATVFMIGHTLLKERNNLRFAWSVWKRFRPIMVLECLTAIVLLAIVYLPLSYVPLLDFGWTNLLFGDSGNMWLKPISDASDSSIRGVRIMVPLFFVAFMIAIPFLAWYEEKMFRHGHTEWNAIVKQSIKFGLIHCVVGVPISAGLAIIVPGLFYGMKYKRAYELNIQKMKHQLACDEALMICTAYHSLYNTIVVGMILLGSILAI